MKYRINKQKQWLKGRSKKYTIVLNPGKYNSDYRVNIPIGLLLRQQKIREKLPDIKKLLNSRKVCINGKVVTQRQYPVSVLDVLTIQGIHYRVSLDKRYKLQSVTTPFTYHSIVKFKELKLGIIQLICKGGFVYLYNAIPKPIKEYVVVNNFKEKSIKVCHYTQLTHFIVIKGKHKGYSNKINQVMIKQGVINLEHGQVRTDYVLFYNK